MCSGDAGARYHGASHERVTLIGEMSLWIALLMAIWAAIVSFAGGALARRELTESGERAIHATLAMVFLAVAGLWTAIYTHDFSISYVASVTSSNLPSVYVFTALWAGYPGSLLLFTVLLAGCAAIALFMNRSSDPKVAAYAAGTLGLSLALCLAVMLVSDNPFMRLGWIPLEGQGMRPRLQNPASGIYRPVLFAGFACAAVACALGVAALVTRRFENTWAGKIRGWILGSWSLTSIAIAIGMWWQYVETERGVYWRWESLEVVSLAVWISGTALGCWIVAKEVRTASVKSRGIFTGVCAVLLGAVMVAAALSARAFRGEHTLSLAAGGSSQVADPFGQKWGFVSQGLSRYTVANRQVLGLALGVSNDAEPAGVIASEKRQYVDSRGAPTFAPSIEPGIRSAWKQDLVVALTRVQDDDSTEIRVSFNPLVRWLWMGWGLVLIGGVFAMWPRRPEEM